MGDAERADSAMAKAIALGLDANDLRHRISLASSGQRATDALAAAPMPGVIQGVVTLAEGIDIDLPPQSRLFVTAKAVDGSTMPIAVLGSHVTEFPYRFTLGNENAMLPGVTLTDFEEIAVSARISASGTAARSADDLESATGVVRVSAPGSVLLVLEQR
jgi:cytochrome c-type biogenesis protein CcmH